MGFFAAAVSQSHGPSARPRSTLRAALVGLGALSAAACASSDASPDAYRAAQDLPPPLQTVAIADTPGLRDALSAHLIRLRRARADIEAAENLTRAWLAQLDANASPDAKAPPATKDMPSDAPLMTAAIPSSQPRPGRTRRNGAQPAHYAHLASFHDESTARAAWTHLQSVYGADLAGLTLRVEATTLETHGPVWRVLAGPKASAAEARSLCAQLTARGAFCAVRSLPPHTT